MSFKKKLFNSNIKVAIIPIVVFSFLVIFLLGLYRKYIMQDLTKNGLTDETTIKVIHQFDTMSPSLLDTEGPDFATWVNGFRACDFGLTIIKDGIEIYTEGPSIKREVYSDVFSDNNSTINNLPITSVNHSKVTVYYRFEYDGATYFLIARSKNHHFTLSAMDEGSIFIGLILFFVLITFTIIVLCRQYSHKLIKQLSHPIDLLGEAANRIESGNLDIPIEYDNDDEFKPVFDSFNEMQSRLKKTIFLSLEHEKKQQEMVAEISHDLKTPLTAIKGYIKGLADGVANTPEKRQHYLDRISDKTNDMNKMIDEILIFSRLDRNKVLFNKESIELLPYLKELAVATTEEYSANSLSISFSEDCVTDVVSIDTLQFGRVFENIVSNSYKYRAALPVQIMITTKFSNDMLAIHINDNGPGVENDKIPYIFDTFYRTDESRNNPVKGSGLGLAICKQIITNFDGTISAYNNNGLCIKIKLPVEKGGSNE